MRALKPLARVPLAVPLAVLLAVPLAVLLVPGPVAAAPAAEGELARRLVAATGAEGAMRHLAAFQAIADGNGGTRAAGTPGHDRSVRYAGDLLAEAGYDVTYQRFTFPYRETTAERLTQLTPASRDMPVHVMSYSPATPAGGLTADLAEAREAGCAEADFGGAFEGSIALIARGECTFAEKQANAARAGALAALIVNDVPGELSGTLGDPAAGVIPTGGIAQDDGQALSEALAAGDTVTVLLELEQVAEDRTTVNVIADSPGTSAEAEGSSGSEVIMAGAHLDSVQDGPGINDNGSGAAAVLDTALRLAGLGGPPADGRGVRFALWSAEESGLLGSEHYVASLADAERDAIAGYLNFDMIASPNYGLFVYDGDGDGVDDGGRSAAIERDITEFLASRGLTAKPTALSGRSDYGPFLAAGVPVGGTFTGAEDLKTEEEAALWGGTAGEPYDPCYHESCDGLGNVSREALDINADVVAHTIATYAAQPEAATQRSAR